MITRAQMVSEFANRYGEGGPVRVFFAPGRVNLIGEHTDYNGGHVFPCALTLGTYGAIRLRDDRKIRLTSLNVRTDEIREASLDDISYQKRLGWANYPLGVIWAFHMRGNHLDRGFDALFYGDIPAGAGLSSSASLEVLTGTMLRDMYHFENVNMIDVAVVAQRAESLFVGVKCGVMDQFASAMGKKDHAIFLSTDSLHYEYIPLKLDGIHIVVTNSEVRHQLGSSEYNKRREECAKALKKVQVVANINSLAEITTDTLSTYKDIIMDPVLIKRTRHVVTENARTIKAVNALRVNNIKRFGELMNESHDSLRDDYEVSCPEIDYLVDCARKVPGVLGSRMTGGGFGGCTVSLVEDTSIDDFRTTLTKKYQEHYNITPEFYVVESGDGARELPDENAPQ